MIISLVCVGIVMYFLQQKEFTHFSSTDALDLIKKKWKEIKGEDLMLVNSMCVPKTFVIDGSVKKFYGFVLTKKDGETFKHIVAWVQTNPKDVFWDDDPSPFRLMNPFYDFYPTDEFERKMLRSRMYPRGGINIFTGKPEEEEEEIKKLKGKKE